MKYFSKMTLAALALGLTSSLAPSAEAATLLGTFTHKYGSDAGRIDPAGNDTLNAKSVTVSDASSPRFSDTISFGSLNYASISYVKLSLSYSGATPDFAQSCPTCFVYWRERWTTDFLGLDDSSTGDNLRTLLDGSPVQVIKLSLAKDIGAVTAFARLLATQALSFRFNEWSHGNDTFRLSSAKLEVYGAPVPLPASGLMLAGALGGAALIRRRKAQA